MRALMKLPYATTAPPGVVQVSLVKSGDPKIPIRGVRMSLVKLVITAPKAAPITTATASSTTFPRRMKSRKPLNIGGASSYPWARYAARTMRLATWNVNSLKARLERVLAWAAAKQPDIFCMQETKLSDELVPLLAFRELGYEIAHHGLGT